jgi:AcrR family transcriptional regulator
MMTAAAISAAGEGWETRPPGRPRSASTHRAIIEATIELFIERGYHGMSIEGVAARAGVGKTAIYRRWPSKEELVVDAIQHLAPDIRPRDTGSLRDDLIDLLVQLQRVLTSTRAGEVIPRMLPEVASGSPLGRTWVRRVIEPRLAMVDAIVNGGIDRGELPPDLDLELARSMLVGPILFAKLFRGLPRKGARARAERIVNALLEGLRVRGSGDSASDASRRG